MTDYIKRRPKRLTQNCQNNNIIEISEAQESPFYLSSNRRRGNKRRNQKAKKNSQKSRYHQNSSWKVNHHKKKVAFEELSTDNSDDGGYNRRIENPFKHMKVQVQGEICINEIQSNPSKNLEKYACASNLEAPKPQNLSIPKFF